MSSNRTANLRIIKILAIAIVISLIAAYAIWRSYSLALGPKIDIYEPLNGSSISSSTVTIRGRAERAINMSLNGRSISVDEKGYWNQTLIIFPGLNTISLEAKDQFGRYISQKLQIVGTH